MSSFGAIGTSPLRDLDASVEHLISEFLKVNYDQSITGVPINEILWEQWYTGSFKDYGLYFQDTGTFDMSTELSRSYIDVDHYTEIHVFAKSTHDDYNRSGEKFLFQFEKWITKVLRQQALALADKGVMVMWFRDSRNVAVESDIEDIKHKVITVLSKIMLINNSNYV